MVLELNLTVEQKEQLKKFAESLNKAFKLDDLRKRTGDSLFELNIDTMTIELVCKLSDLNNGTYYPKIGHNRLYLFRLNYKNANKAFRRAIDEVFNALNG